MTHYHYTRDLCVTEAQAQAHAKRKRRATYYTYRCEECGHLLGYSHTLPSSDDYDSPKVIRGRLHVRESLEP